MKRNIGLPGWCRILDELIWEIAKEGEAKDELKRSKGKAKKKGVDRATYTESTPTTMNTYRRRTKGGVRL